MMSGISSNFSGLNQSPKPPYGVAYGKPGAGAGQPQGAVAGAGQGAGAKKGAEGEGRRNLFYDSDTSAIEGLMLMKSAAQIPQGDGEWDLSALSSCPERKRPRRGDYEFGGEKKE